jgi:hypothetical protein
MCRKERAGEREDNQADKGRITRGRYFKINKNLKSTETNCNTCHGAGERRRSRKCW